MDSGFHLRFFFYIFKHPDENFGVLFLLVVFPRGESVKRNMYVFQRVEGNVLLCLFSWKKN